MVILVVGLKKQVAIFVEGPGDSQVDSAAASQDDFIGKGQKRCVAAEVTALTALLVLPFFNKLFIKTRRNRLIFVLLHPNNN